MANEQSSILTPTTATQDEEDLHRSMVAFAQKLAKNPEAAMEFLQRAGIVTKNGELSKNYGG